ncbi:hypothetical protein BaRGS_00025189 [Batillaria attramentaria]|uniref:Kinesin-like protein n=1 Tax=Batillaria attramentaria TaxID=370345 RepID=A0ABD0K8Z5_9CAEN
MVKQTIKIFARIKPTKPGKTGLYETDEDDEGFPRLTVTVPRELASGFINNKRETYKFRFDRCFDQATPQDEVFQHVAKPVIDNVLQGYNGTIFAYGQTGSGKTFTITGGAERYIDRGIIPRSLSYIFSKTESNPDLTFTIHISYLEIYNESGYDLLDPKHEAAKLEDLPKVSLLEDSDQNIHLKNLTVHQAASEEEALNLLFLGDTNRMIAETPMNQASSRSHCIFTVHVTTRESGSATIRRAKLHLVDLAGSERVGKTGVNGVLLTEAKYINLSLHFLEQVIIALSEKNRQHVPYRNSMMTSVLRDSLGGNCMTTMIATCSMEKRSVDESISTCRFAQRVAMIRNDVMLNEELDPKLLIQKLKRENQELREQLNMATGEQLSDELTADELQWCEDSVKRYLEDSDADSYLSAGHDLRKIQLCFKILKRYVMERPAPPQQPLTPPRPESPPDVGPYSKAENARLKDLLLQRDNEINILVNMLKKEKKRAADAEAVRGGVGPQSARRNSETNGHMVRRSGQEADRREHGRPSSEILVNQSGQRTTGSADKDELGPMSLGRQEAFDIFLRDYHHSQAIEENKQVLKQRYGQAKALGERLNTSKQRINHLKAEVEDLRLQGDFSEEDLEEMEHGMREEMEREKMMYKETFVQLRTMKTEIEHLQHLLEKAKVKMMKDFEMWWAQQSQANQAQASEQQPGVRSAWNTPPITPSVNGGNSSQRNYTQEVMSRTSGDSDRPPLRPLGSGRQGRGMAANLSGGRQSEREGTYTLNSAKPGVSGSGGGDIPLTGDPQADADIMAFIRARQNILQQDSRDILVHFWKEDGACSVIVKEAAT